MIGNYEVSKTLDEAFGAAFVFAGSMQNKGGNGKLAFFQLNYSRSMALPNIAKSIGCA